MKTSTLLWYLLGLCLLAAAAFLCADLLPVQAQTEPFNMENSEPGIRGENCSVFAFPGAVYATDTGTIMRCDPDTGIWKLFPLETTKLTIRVAGTCASGADSGDPCYTNADCTGSSCSVSDPINLIDIVDGVNWDADSAFATLARYDFGGGIADIYAPYPGQGSPTSAPVSRFVQYGTGCTGDGCDVADLAYPTTRFGDTSKPGGAYVLVVEGAFNATGKGTAGASEAGLYQGYVEHQLAEGADRYYSDFKTTVSGSVGRITRVDADDAMCVEWWDGAASPAKDFSFCRTAADTLSLAGGDLEIDSPSMLESGWRTILWAGDQEIANSEFEADASMRPAGWPSEDFTAGQGFTMPAAGSIISVSAFCQFDGGKPVTGGELRGHVLKNGVEVYTCDSASITAGDNGPHHWSCSQARGTDTFSADDYVEWQIGETGTLNIGGGGECLMGLGVVFDD